MNLEGAFLVSEGALLHSLPKRGGHGPFSPPITTSLQRGASPLVATRVWLSPVHSNMSNTIQEDSGYHL